MIINVVSEMKRKANGRATVAFVRLTSVIMIITDRPPKIRNDRIIKEFKIFLIRSTSISNSSKEVSDHIVGQATSHFILFKKVVYSQQSH